MKESANFAQQLALKFLWKQQKELGMSDEELAQKAQVSRLLIKALKIEGHEVDLTLKEFFALCGALSIYPYLSPEPPPPEDTQYLHFQ